MEVEYSTRSAGSLLRPLRTNLYSAHVLLSNTSRHVHEVMLMRVKDGNRVAYSVILGCWSLSALWMKSHGKFVSSSVADMEAQSDEEFHTDHFGEQAPVP